MPNQLMRPCRLVPKSSTLTAPCKISSTKTRVKRSIGPNDVKGPQRERPFLCTLSRSAALSPFPSNSVAMSLSGYFSRLLEASGKKSVGSFFASWEFGKMLVDGNLA